MSVAQLAPLNLAWLRLAARSSCSQRRPAAGLGLGLAGWLLLAAASILCLFSCVSACICTLQSGYSCSWLVKRGIIRILTLADSTHDPTA
jgi:hypothetical protein